MQTSLDLARCSKFRSVYFVLFKSGRVGTFVEPKEILKGDMTFPSGGGGEGQV